MLLGSPAPSLRGSYQPFARRDDTGQCIATRRHPLRDLSRWSRGRGEAHRWHCVKIFYRRAAASRASSCIMRHSLPAPAHWRSRAGRWNIDVLPGGFTRGQNFRRCKNMPLSMCMPVAQPRDHIAAFGLDHLWSHRLCNGWRPARQRAMRPALIAMFMVSAGFFARYAR